MRRQRVAMTFLELVIVVLIISILTGVAAPKFSDSYRRSRVDAAARRVQADLHRARQFALSRSTSNTVNFHSMLSSYTVLKGDNLDNRNDAYQVKLSQAPYGVTLIANTVGASGSVIFNMYGIPNNGGTISVSSEGYTQTVTINQNTGLATIP